MKSDPNKNKMLNKEEKEIPFEYAVMYNCSGGGGVLLGCVRDSFKAQRFLF